VLGALALAVPLWLQLSLAIQLRWLGITALVLGLRGALARWGSDVPRGIQRLVPLLWPGLYLVGMVLISGGLGLIQVAPSQWGGLLLTLVAAALAVGLAPPLLLVIAPWPGARPLLQLAWALARSHGVGAWLGQTLRRMIFRRFAAFLVVGQANRTYYRRCGVPASRLIDAPHAVDNDRFLAAADGASRHALLLRERLGIHRDSNVVLFVGKFVDVKRAFDILEAFDQLTKGLRDGAALVFVGDGPHGPSLIRRARDRDLTNVHVLPFQNQQAMPAIYALGNVLVLASQSETWGLVVNEAMNLACPAIVTDNVGCRGDLVVDGRTGWIYPTGDIAALNRCLREALEDPDRLRAMGREARRHVAGFNFDGITAGLLDAIDRSGGSKLRLQPPKIASDESG
jgi:glycosyltransferase involved in cell wall biosynthesis